MRCDAGINVYGNGPVMERVDVLVWFNEVYANRPTLLTRVRQAPNYLGSRFTTFIRQGSTPALGVIPYVVQHLALEYW